MKKIVVYTAATLCIAQVVLVLVSWLITAAMPESFTHSLLSSEGIRWFFGRFTDNLASHYLVWLVLASMACGTVKNCGILQFSMEEYRQRVAIRLVVVELVVFVAVILALTMLPHAILLNSMGSLFPSPFSKSVLPYVCFAVIVMSVSFGVMSERLNGIVDVFNSLTDGVKMASPLFLLYVLAVQLYSSIVYLL